MGHDIDKLATHIRGLQYAIAKLATRKKSSKK